MRISIVLALVTSLAACVGGSDELAVPPTEDAGCTHGVAFWRTHPEAWPLTSIVMGEHSYGRDRSIEIMNLRAPRSELVALARQLIASRLDVAAGANDLDVADAIVDADLAIGELVIGFDELPTGASAGVLERLVDFNTGASGPGACAEPTPIGLAP